MRGLHHKKLIIQIEASPLTTQRGRLGRQITNAWQPVFGVVSYGIGHYQYLGLGAYCVTLFDLPAGQI